MYMITNFVPFVWLAQLLSSNPGQLDDGTHRTSDSEQQIPPQTPAVILWNLPPVISMKYTSYDMSKEDNKTKVITWYSYKARQFSLRENYQLFNYQLFFSASVYSI